MKHELKIWPQYYKAVADGRKTFEVRQNDRGFQSGDTVILMEWDPALVERESHHPLGIDVWEEPRGYTGAELTFAIGYVLPIDAERVVFSLLPHPPESEAAKDGKA